MKSCLGMLLVLLVFFLVVGGAGAIWYMSYSAEFSRKDQPPPRAAPVPGGP
jgi:flagellar basal body-associated protein FliL